MANGYLNNKAKFLAIISHLKKHHSPVHECYESQFVYKFSWVSPSKIFPLHYVRISSIFNYCVPYKVSHKLGVPHIPISTRCKYVLWYSSYLYKALQIEHIFVHTTICIYVYLYKCVLIIQLYTICAHLSQYVYMGERVSRTILNHITVG